MCLQTIHGNWLPVQVETLSLTRLISSVYPRVMVMLTYSTESSVLVVFAFQVTCPAENKRQCRC